MSAVGATSCSPGRQPGVSRSCAGPEPRSGDIGFLIEGNDAAPTALGLARRHETPGSRPGLDDVAAPRL